MSGIKSLVIAVGCMLLVATATAQDRAVVVDPAAAARALAASEGMGVRSTASGDLTVGQASGDLTVGQWNWYLPERTENVSAGTSSRYVFAYFRNSGDYVYILASDTRADILNLATAGNHYLAIKWTSSSTWADSLLYYF